ncbi:MAG: adenosylcobinamide-GDP ribazoletransferase [Anaerovoracaceae bacterium]
MKLINGFFMAWGCFSIIPCPYKKWDEEARNHMLALLPFVGVLIGAINLAIYYGASYFGIDEKLQALGLMFLPFWLSGFMHLDGFMDCNDAIMSRRPLEERQRILKDSMVGAFAVITTILMFLAFYVATLIMVQSGSLTKVLIFVSLPYFTRLVSILNVILAKPMGTSQYAKSYLDQSKAKTAQSCIIGHGVFIMAIVILVLKHGLIVWQVGVPLTAMVLQQLVIMKGRKDLGGMNGDISGYGIVLGEMFGALILAAF